MNIQLKNFSYKIPGEAKALFSIPELEIKSRERLLIRGPSGSGKSSFLHALAGLIPSATGEAWFDRQCLQQLPEHDKCVFRAQHLGLIFQRLSLFDHFTMLENLLIENSNKEHALSLMARFHLIDRSEILVRQASLGEQQKLAILRAFMKNFSILMADEPTSSLDDSSTTLVMQEIVTGCKDKTLICVSHDQRIEKYFDRTLQFTQFEIKGRA